MLELKKWIIENDCIDKIRKYGNIQNIYQRVYIVNLEGTNYFIKNIPDGNQEYEVAKQLETLSLPTFQKISNILYSDISLQKIIDKYKLLQQKNKKYYYILSEEVKGQSLFHMIKDLSRSELNNIIQAILFSLRLAWEKLRFVHNDLHLSNIIIQKIEEPIHLTSSGEYHHSVFQFENEITISKYLPILIDFDRSVTEKYTTDLFKHKTIEHDIWKLLGTLSLYLNDEKGELILDYIEHFIDRYEFQERKEEFCNQWFHVLPS
jgi:hypothetical protein